MIDEVTELEGGRVFVRVRSKRGTETRDEDEVVASACFSDIESAEEESHKLNRLVKERLVDAREVTNPPEELENNSAITEAGEARSVAESSLDSSAGDEDISKIYIGDGSQVNGWTPLPRQIVFEEIAPIVSNNEVDDSQPSIELNFTKDVPLNGWCTVDVDAVRDLIEPIIQQHRLDDGLGQTTNSTEKTWIVNCPVGGCGYNGRINQIIGHLMGSNHSNSVPEINCPVEECSYKGTVDAVGGHFHSKQDSDHDTVLLAEHRVFDRVDQN